MRCEKAMSRPSAPVGSRSSKGSVAQATSNGAGETAEETIGVLAAEEATMSREASIRTTEFFLDRGRPRRCRRDTKAFAVNRGACSEYGRYATGRWRSSEGSELPLEWWLLEIVMVCDKHPTLL